MAEERLILWPRATWWDHAWNPIIGCHKCSPACQNCWAEAWAKRFHQSFEPHKSSARSIPRKGVVFMGSLSDLFGDWVDEAQITGWMARAVRPSKAARYMWLTKRADNMKRALEFWSARLNRPEVWFQRNYFGITAENQEWFNIRVDAAAGIPLSFNQWLSAEPLLGPIDMGDMVEMFKWVVVGAESGPNRRPCKIEWVESIVEQCRIAGVPVFVKQICLPNGTFTNKIEEFPKHLRIRQVPWTIGKDK